MPAKTATKSLVDEERYTVPQLAEMFGVSTDNVYNKISTGQLKAYTFGRKLFVPKSALDEYLSSTTKEVPS